jgi:FtsZ-binding cell division protein ZapB
MKIKENEKKYLKNGKGGRKLKISNKSLTFNIPVGYSCSIQELKEINKTLTQEIIKLYKAYNFDIKENEIYNIIHYQDNPHIHALLPYLDKNGEVIRKIKSKNFLNELKLIFNYSVDSVLGTDFKAYKSLQEEQREHNRVILYLEELLSYYKHLLSIEDSKYYKNQVISIERILKDNPKEISKEVQTIINNSEKVQELRIKTNMKTIKLPTI